MGEKGALYLACLPIGNDGDITLRTLEILAKSDIVLAEDTRRCRRLWADHSLSSRLISYHDHSSPARHRQIITWLNEGQQIALVSDAGAPVISDPGYNLIQAVIAAGHDIQALPGPSALTCAVMLSGLPVHHFCFLGFAAHKSNERRRLWAAFASIPAGLVIFETARRLVGALEDMIRVFGNRRAAILREMTKTHQDIQRGFLRDLHDHYTDHQPRGEVTIVITPGTDDDRPTIDTITDDLRQCLKKMSLSQAVRQVSTTSSLPRSAVYQHALALQAKDEN